MKELFEKLALGLLRAKMSVKDAVENVVDDERGDTNFISIAIILIIVLVIAVLFITFGKEMTDGMSNQMDKVRNELK